MKIISSVSVCMTDKLSKTVWFHLKLKVCWSMTRECV